MIEKICNRLLTVKSIVTIILTVVFAVLVIRGTLPSEFMTVYASVLAFYFGIQSTKKEE